MCQTAARPNRQQKNQGQNWITPRKRLAIYSRDGFACAWCGKGIETGLVLTLDHLVPYSKGGALIDPHNLVTACRPCNSARGNRPWQDFAQVAATDTRDAACILAAVRRQVQRELDTRAAGQLLAQRGTCRKVLDQVHQGDPL